MNALHNTVDNTISITPAAPVDAATFARLRAAGFAWRMDSGAFIAADNDQARALAAELAGHIENTPPDALQASGEEKTSEEWEPSYSPWRHGGWYVSNIHHRSGACGCVSNNYPDKKWRIVCDERRNGLNDPGDFTFSTRHAAAIAEHELSLRAADTVQDSGEDDHNADSAPPCADIERATYSPEDNKIRLYPTRRLDPELYARVKAAGFSWAPKQGVFVAPMWTPSRADLAEELAGELGDEDTTLAERAAERAERFEDYQGKRAADADSARRGVDAIAQHIPFGQPILIGHHSERRARRDAQRIEDGMRRAVKLWETAEYWTQRAAGAIRHAKYKELPAVRARRIKTIEAAQRKAQREQDQARAKMALWTRDGLTLEQARATADRVWFTVAHENGHQWTAYDVLQPKNDKFPIRPAWTIEQVQAHARKVYPRTIAHCQRWIDHYQNRLAYERAMLNEQGAGHLLEKPKRTAPPPILNYRAPEGFTVPSRWNPGTMETLAQIEMTKAQYMAIREEWRATRTVDGHRIRICINSWRAGATREAVFLTDSKTHPRPEKAAPDATPPEPSEADADQMQPSGEVPAIEPAEPVQPSGEEIAAPETSAPDPAATFAAMRDSLRTGVQVITAPQLFPTPAPLAARMVELANIQPGARVLEPSAGTGRLLGAMGGRMFGHNPERGAVHAIEINRELAGRLQAEFPLTTVSAADFLQCVTADYEPFDRILMNPPFAKAADIAHIQHAAGMLKPGGRLVALCANGPRQRATLQPLASYWEDLPAGTFAESGTGVNVALLIMDAPAANCTDDDTSEADQVQPSGEPGTHSGEALTEPQIFNMTKSEAGKLTPEQARALLGSWWFGGEGEHRLNTEEGRQALHRAYLRHVGPWDIDAIPDHILESHATEPAAFDAHDWFSRELWKKQNPEVCEQLKRDNDDADQVQASGEEIETAAGVVSSGEKSAPSYTIQHNIGRAKYVVNFHDGQKTHADGSPFFDVEIFNNKRRMHAFVMALRERGYSYGAPTVQDWGEQPTKPTPPKIQTVERRDRDGVTRVYLAHLPKGCTELYPLQYSQPGMQAQRIAQLRAAGIAATARGPGIEIDRSIVVDPSGEAPPLEPSATLIPGRWIPGGADKAERIACDAATGAEVWLTGSTSRPGALAVIAYSGKRAKHDAFYTMPDRERAQQWAAEYLAKLQRIANERAARIAEQQAKRAAGHKLQVGDVLRSVWGYDQTNVDYYEVTNLVGKTMVEIRKIAAQSVESGHMTGECVPSPGHYIGEPMRKTVSTYDGQSVRIASYAGAYKIEPREVAGVKVWPVDHWTAYA